MLDLCSFDEEIKCGFFVSGDMKKLRNIQLNMLHKLLEICKKRNIAVYASGGTLLGAIRHNGYIPWDDDIDVEMFRSDYDKLVSVASQEFQSPFFFQCAYTDNGYYRGHAQIRFNGTSQIIPGEIYRDFHQGVFIDIFVLDDVPSDEKLKNNLFQRTQLMLNYLWTRRYLGKDSFNIFRWINLALKLKTDCLKGDVELFEMFESEFRSNHSDTVALISFDPYEDRWYRERAWYSSSVYVKFEGVNIPVPADYDKILSKQFGNYMTPVKAPSVHGETITSLVESYEQILQTLRKPFIVRLLKKFYNTLMLKY